MATTIFDLNFIKHENSSSLRILVYANIYSPDDIQFTGEIVLDGNSIQSCYTNIILDTQNSQGQMPLSPFAYLPGIGSGTHNIKFIVTNNEVDNVNLVIRSGATIEVSELKQGAR